MKKTYVVALGVTHINGVPVPPSRRMRLTASEALYDLSHGNLTLAPARKSAKRQTAE